MSASVSLPTPRPPRPMGVALSAIVLALMTCMGLLSAGSIFLGALFIRTPQLAKYPVIETVQISMGVVLLLICGFCGWTVIGLFRLKGWARISMVILGAIVGFFSFGSAVLYCVIAFSPFAVPPDTPNVSAAVFKGIFLSMAGVSLVFMGVGIWWLVYFNRSRVRLLFTQNGTRLSEAGALPPEDTAGIWIDPGEPKSGLIEVLMTCLAVLYLIAGVSGIIGAFFHFPFFFMGLILRGGLASAAVLAFSIVNLALGVGILRRVKAAWITAIVFDGLGLIHTLLMFTPRYRAILDDYQQELMRSMFSGGFPQAPQTQLMMGPIHMFSAGLGVLGMGAVLWLLIRARPMFGVREESI